MVSPQLGAPQPAPGVANQSVGSSGLSGTPGLFGQGMYQSPTFNIDQQAMNNPNYVPGQYQGLAGNYLTQGGANQQLTAQQSGAGNYGNYNTGTAGQLGLAQQYQNMAAGQGPSLAAVQAQQQGAANLAANESMLGSARGAGNPAAAQLAARNAQTQGQQQVVQNAVAGRTNEELGAMGGAASAYGNVAGQGLQQVGAQQSNTQFNAGQGNQIGMANQSTALNANTNLLNSYANQGLAQQQGAMAGQQLGVQQQLGLGNIGAGAYASAAKNNQALSGGIMNGIGGFLGGL